MPHSENLKRKDGFYILLSEDQILKVLQHESFAFVPAMPNTAFLANR